MRNTLKNHHKVYGQTLGHVVFNSGYNPGEVSEDFAKELYRNYQESATIGQVVDVIWNGGEYQGLTVHRVSGVFVTLKWKSGYQEYQKAGLPFDYSYGEVQVYNAFVRKCW